MASFNATDLSKLHQFLPELTLAQKECVLLYSLGFSTDEIAHLRGVGVKTIKKQLDEGRASFDGVNLSSLRNIVLLRLIGSLVH